MRRGDPPELVETFPVSFDVSRAGLAFLPAKRVLDPVFPHELLYWERSHGHWTPAAHALSGEALAALIEERGLLPSPGSGACPSQPASRD
jgi:hypothetical protein